MNLASRLESAPPKSFKVDILIGENTADLVRDTMTVRTVDLLQVQGKDKPVEVFTVLDWNPRRRGCPSGAREGRAALPRALSSRKPSAASPPPRRLQPEDWLIQEYLRRVREYQAAPPGAEWDGVHVLTNK